ncbi:MAG: dockerin type I domain-containing protein, partial [Limnohabitans sp.]|nr:dockerin type I domain-containing protein [Limnohabitans sp.]
ASSTACASGAQPFGALVVAAGGYCISEYCTVFDANDVPDACECATNPALPSCCMGDLFNDGAVNAADLAVVLTQWGEKGAGLEADLDGNGVVDGTDLAIVLSNWGACQ